MVRVCCVKSCKVFWVPNSDVSFFAFPLNNKELKEKWLNAGPGYKTLSKYSAICYKHFLPQDYTESGGKRRLNKDAVPSLFGTDCIKAPDPTPEIIYLMRNDVTSQPTPNVIQFLQRCDPPVSKKYSDVAVQTCPRLSGPSELEKELRAKIKLLQERLRRREKRISNVEGVVADLKKSVRTENLEEKFLAKFTKFDLDLFKNIAKNTGVSKSKKTYTQEMKEFAISLYYCSPKAYKFVRDKMNLPHAATLRRWIAEAGKEEKLLDLEADDCEGIEEDVEASEDIEEEFEAYEDVEEDIEMGESTSEEIDICENSEDQSEGFETIVLKIDSTEETVEEVLG